MTKMVRYEGRDKYKTWDIMLDIDLMYSPSAAFMYRQIESQLERQFGMKPNYETVMNSKKMPFFFITEAQVKEGVKKGKL